MEATIFLPTLSHWIHKNAWTGSLGDARFAATVEEELIQAEVWRGPLSRPFAQPEFASSFPVSEEGLVQLGQWLEDQCRILNGG